MTLRTFEDSSGALWTVWDTVRSSDTPVTAALVDGWLTFDSASEKRRLAPIPGGWVAATDRELERLLALAEPVARGRVSRLLGNGPARAAATAAARAPSTSAAGARAGAAATTGTPAAAVPGAPQGTTLRTFTDAGGLTWSVWAVRPGAAPNGDDAPERRAEAMSAAGAPRGALPHVERRLQVRSEYARGWLAFHAASGARRRLMPIPERWQTLPDEELERCCRTARPMPDAER